MIRCQPPLAAPGPYPLFKVDGGPNGAVVAVPWRGVFIACTGPAFGIEPIVQGWSRLGRVALSGPTSGGASWRPSESRESSVRHRLAPDRESFPCHQVTLRRVAGRDVCIRRAGSPQQSQSAAAATPPSGTGSEGLHLSACRVA